MGNADAMRTVHEAVEAHGGINFWNGIEALDAVISARGFLFMAKRRPVLQRVRMRAAAHEPRFTMFDFPKPGQRADLIGNDEVRILDGEGKIVARRENPRAAFRGLRRQFAWDDLDFAYFGGYATWNYLTTPFMLLREGVIIKALESLPGTLARLTRVQATFPDEFPTHSRRQVFYFDEGRLLRRLDYTAEVVGGWARAAHLCDEYRQFGGLKVATRRRVLPLPFGNNPLPGPLLVELDLHDVRPVPG
jgi:hypothetical protein